MSDQIQNPSSMLESILEGETRRPTPAVRFSAENLQRAATTAARATLDQSHSYIDPAALADQTSPIRVDAIIRQQIIAYYQQQYGILKGPTQNAIALIDSWGARAIRAHYRLDDPNVLRAFAQFLLAVATEGFENEDVTGTQIGNFKGSWRGGGFK